MNISDIGLLIAAGGGLTGLAAMLRVWHDRRRGIASDEQIARAEEREDRRDIRSDLNDLIDRLLEEGAAMRSDIQRLREQETENRQRIESLEQDRRIDRAHIKALEDWIWQQKPPPPPPRPKG